MGIGSFIESATTLFTGMQEAGAESEAARTQRDREFRQANMAIEGAQQKGAFESGRQRLLGAQMGGKQKLAYTASGVDAASGTAAAVQADTQAINERDAREMSINAAREVWGFKEAKRQSQENETMHQQNAQRKRTSAVVGSLTKFLSGVGGSMAGG